MLSLLLRGALLPGVLVSTAAASTSRPIAVGIEIEDPRVRIVEGPEGDADLTVGFGVPIRNTCGSAISIEIAVQGLDRDGEELHDVFLSGAVEAGQSTVLADTDLLKQARFRSIVTWRIEDAVVRVALPVERATPRESRGTEGNEEPRP